MPNYCIEIEYDGNDFFGWQFQKNQRTVQGEIEKALENINGGKFIRVNGAGRTDSGVHATGQVANFFIEDEWECNRLRKAINGNIQDDVIIKKCKIVEDKFHARFSAVKRSYKYICRTNISVIDRKYVWVLPNKLNIDCIQECATMILGDNDFTSYSKYNSSKKNRRCIIYQSEWINDKDFLIYNIEGNRFLRHLIRYLVGTMVSVGSGQLSPREFYQILHSQDPAAKVFKAPPYGLYFESVTY